MTSLKEKFQHQVIKDLLQLDVEFRSIAGYKGRFIYQSSGQRLGVMTDSLLCTYESKLQSSFKLSSISFCDA